MGYRPGDLPRKQLVSFWGSLPCPLWSVAERRCYPFVTPSTSSRCFDSRNSAPAVIIMNKLGLLSLEQRRLHSDLIMCYKIIFGIVGVCNRDFFQFYTAKSTRGHPYKLCKEHNTSTIRQNFFSQRVINAWNYLPLDTVDFTSLRSFKRTIELVDLSTFLKCS